MKLHQLIIIFVLFSNLGCVKEEKVQEATIYKYRMGHDMRKDSAQHMAALRFAKLVEKRSKGLLTISVHPAEELGTDHVMIDLAREGKLDIILPPTAKLSLLEPAMGLLDLPFLFPDRKTCYQVLDGATGKRLLKKLDSQGLVGVSFWESGFKQFTSDRPIRKASDFKNMKFRIMRSQILESQFRALGANSLVIEFGKTYQALADKVANGQENPLSSIFNMNFHNVQSHLIISNHGYLGQVLAFSKKSYHQLPQHLQNILFNTGLELTKYEREEAQRREKKYIEEIRKTDTKIIKITDKNKIGIKKILLPIIEKERMKIGTDIIEMALEEISKNETLNKDKIYIGLDADLAGSSALSGMGIKRGMEIAIKEINDNGGVLGRELGMISRDNSMVSARGINNIEEFSKVERLIAVMGGISSPVALSELDLIHKKKIIYLGPWAAATNIVKNGREPNFVFRISVRDEYAAEYLIKNAIKLSKKVGLLLVNNGWGRGNHKGILEALEKRGLRPSRVEFFDWGESAHKDKIDLIYRSGAGVIVYVGNGLEGAEFIKILAKKERPIPIVSHWGLTGTEFPKWVGDALEKVDLRVLQTHSFINRKDKLNLEFVEKYKKKYSVLSAHEILAPVGTAHAYDLVHLLVKAIKKAKSFDRIKVRNELEKLDRHRGLVKTYDPPFSRRRHDALDLDDFILTKYSDGHLVPLK